VAVEESGFLEKALQEAAAKSTTALWVVVDAIDEADVVPGRNALSLPTRLPKNVYCFVTQRPGAVLLATDPTTPIIDETFAWDSDFQQSDVFAFLQHEVTQDMLKAKFPGTPRQSVIDQLARLSEGNFMYLRYVLSDLAAPESAGGLANDALDLPRGLPGYYAAMWSRMEALTQGGGSQEWRTLYRPVIGLLAVAAEPVTVEWLAALSNCDAEDIRNPVLYKWRRFLRSDAGRWRILHKSFADFLSETLDLKARHAGVAHYFEDTAHWVDFEGYAFRHQSTHLRQARDLAGVIRLTSDRDWYEHQVTMDPSGVEYASDVRQALLLAVEVNRNAVANGGTAPALVDELRLTLMLSTLSDHWTSIPVDTMNALLEVGILSDAQALGLIEQQEPSVRGASLCAIAHHLSPQLVQRAVEIALQLDADNRAETLQALAEIACVDQRDELMEAALAAALSIDDDHDSKPHLILKASAARASHEADALTSRALELASGADDPYDRARRLAPLVGNIPDALQRLLKSLQDAMKQQGSDGAADDGLLDIVRAVPDAYRPEVARTAVAVAQNLAKKSERAATLCGLVGELPEAERSSVLSLALDAVRSLSDLDDPAQFLFELAAATDGTARVLLLQEAHTVIGRMGSTAGQAAGLLRLSAAAEGARRECLMEQGLQLLEDDADITTARQVLVASAQYMDSGQRDVVLTKALPLVMDLPSRFEQVRESIAIAETWSEDRLRDMVRSVARIPAGILAIGEPPEDRAEQAVLLASFLPDLRGPAADHALDTVCEHLEHLNRPFARACIRVKTLSVLSSEDEKAALERVRADADAVDNAAERTDVLVAVAEQLPEAHRSELLDEALGQARSIEPGGMTISGTIQMRTGVVTIHKPSRFNGRPSLAILSIALLGSQRQRDALIAEAVERTFDLPQTQQVKDLADLAFFLSPAQIRDVIGRYRAVLQDPLRQVFHETLSELLEGNLADNPQEGHQPNAEQDGDAEEASADDDDNDRDGTHFKLQLLAGFGEMYKLRHGPEQAFFQLSFGPEYERFNDEEREDARFKVLRGVASNFMSVSFEEARSLHLASTTFRGGTWHWCIGRLLQALGRLESADDALKLAQDIWASEIPPLAAASLANIAGNQERAALVKSAIAFANSEAEVTERTLAICLVMPCLDPVATRGAAGLLPDLADRLAAGDVMNLLRSVNMQDLPEPVVLSLVQRVLHSGLTRRSLLDMLADLIPALRRLGGESFAQTLPDAIDEAIAFVH
jgi:hypothetical protein